MNDKSHTYLHPATGNFSSLDLSLCHPSLLLDFDWTVSEDQHGSDHFPVIIESVNNSTNDHNAKWKLNKANWELYHSLCEESLKIDKFNSLDPLDDFTSSLLDIPWVLNFPPCRGPGGSIPTGNVASLVSSNCPLWEERRGNTTRLPWVATRKPEEGILEVESYWEFVLS